MKLLNSRNAIAAALAALALGGCATGRTGNMLPPANFVGTSDAVGENYLIGASDELSIYVWRNPELSTRIAVRPDGRITTPLISDMVAVGKTPAQLAEDIKQVLNRYIQDPIVSVMVERPNGTF